MHQEVYRHLLEHLPKEKLQFARQLEIKVWRCAIQYICPGRSNRTEYLVIQKRIVPMPRVLPHTKSTCEKGGYMNTPK